MPRHPKNVRGWILDGLLTLQPLPEGDEHFLLDVVLDLPDQMGSPPDTSDHTANQAGVVANELLEAWILAAGHVGNWILADRSAPAPEQDPASLSSLPMVTATSKRAAIVAIAVAMSSGARPSGQAPTMWQFENITAGPAPGSFRTVAIAGFEYDADKRPVVAWREDSSTGAGTLAFWTRNEGGAWNTHEFRSERNSAFAHQFVLRPSDGNPFVLYAARGPNGEFASYLADLATFDSSAGTSTSTYIEWLVPPQHAAGVHYSLGFTAGATFPDWATGLAEANGFGPMRIDGAEVGSGYIPHGALAITPNGTRHLLWNASNEVFYSRWPAADVGPTTFPTPLVTNLNPNGGEVNLVSDANGFLHAAIQDNRGTLTYIESTDDGGTWTAAEPIDTGIGINRGISLAVGGAHVPAVTYWRGDQELWFARRDGPGGTWTQSFVTTMPNANETDAARLHFDSADDPVIAFHDRNTHQIRLARPVPAGVTLPIDIALVGAVSPAVSQPGGRLTYKLTVTNNGTTNVDHVVLSNTLPPGVVYVDASPGPGADGRWALGLLTAGASATVTISADAPPVAGDVVDVASVTSDGPDTVPGNNAAAIGVTVRPVECFDPASPPGLLQCGAPTTDGLDVAASVTSAPNPAVIDGVITYILKATNTGTVDAANVTLTNALPPGVLFIDSAPAPGSNTSDEQVYVLDLPVGVSRWVVIHGRAQFPGTFVDWASVYVDGDTNTANDKASTSTDVKPDACFMTPNGLVSRWRGEDNPNDDVGGHAGDLQGTATFAAGRVGDAFSFDGTSGYVTVPDAPELRPAQFTLSAWIDPSGLRTSFYDIVFTKGTSFQLGFDHGRPALFNHVDGQFVGTAASSVLQPGQWNLLTATHDGATARVYLNGALVAQQLIGPVVYDDAPLGIGASVQNGQLVTSDLFNGLIDDVTLHNRALTDDEVRALYDGSSPNCPPPNHAPEIVNPGDQTSLEGDTISLPISATDADGNALTYRATGLPQGLTLDPMTHVIGGHLGFQTAGRYDVTLTVDDGIAVPTTASFAWTVTNVACNPVAFPDTAETPVDTAIDIPVLDNDVTPTACIAFGAPTFSGVSQPPQHGTVVLDDKLRTATYMPAAGFAGIDTFSYAITNSDGGSATATVTVTVGTGVVPPVVISLVENILVADVITSLPAAMITISETVAVADSIAPGVIAPAVIAITEGIAVQETLTPRPSAMVTITEAVVVAESIAPGVIAPAVITIAEGVNVAETLTPRPSAMVTIAETVAVAELIAPGVIAPAVVRITEGVGVDETLAPRPSVMLTVTETVAVSDATDVVADNTATGAGVTVQPPDQTGATPVTVTFSDVTRAGITFATTSSIGPATPAGFALGKPPVYFDITTTAGYTPPIKVCINYGGMIFKKPAALRLFHFEGGVWADLTVSLDLTQTTVCAVANSLSPFAVFEPANQSPVANAGPDQVREATSPSGATATLNGSTSSDPDGDPLTFTWTGPFGTRTGAMANVTVPLGTNIITLTVDDGHGGTSNDTIVVTVRDTIAPAVTIASPIAATYEFNQVVTASYACVDGGSGIATCAGPAPSGTVLDTSTEGPHAFSVTATDAAGNSTIKTVTYTVAGLEGRMTGDGEIEAHDGPEHRFEFHLAERHIGVERGELHYTLTTPKSGRQNEKTDRFDSTSIGSITFWDNPAFKPGRGPRPTVDSVIFSGTGRWNGAPDYTFEARASDGGEPGRGHDTFAITIRDWKGMAVATVSGTLTEGNIQSERLDRR